MPDTTLNNTATASGSYNGINTSMSSTAVATLLVDGLSITKAVDQEVWVTGPLTYTITVTNNAELPYESPTITDILDPAIVTLVTDSVTIDGTGSTGYTFDSGTGTLVVTIPTLAIGDTVVVTFQVQKV